MITKITTLYKISIATLLLCFMSTWVVSGRDPGDSRLERQADRAFIRGFYAKSMEINETALAGFGKGTFQYTRLQIKMARLYTLLQNHDKVVEHYGSIHGTAADSLLSVNDICYYVDALRLKGEDQRAESIARFYAYRWPYSRNQRYINMLNALSNKQHYYNRGDSDYSVQLSNRSTELPEYWLGNWDGETFYAVSHSPLQDPLKVFYHRTQYFSYDTMVGSDSAPLKSIPRELQSGPIAFSEDKSVMVATGINYNHNDRIKSLYEPRGFFNTQIQYSIIDTRRGGWSKPMPLFEYQAGYSYAHPTFFNNSQSLLFCSDRPGGYGGMDLYVIHWDASTRKWSEPKNLGPSVNTEGDEIYPLVVGNQVFFSSNGQEGFGGYDIYCMRLDGQSVVPGTMYHYPYPTNTASNDFGVFFEGHTAYFISDRRGTIGGDDIYIFDDYISPLARDLDLGVSDEYSAMIGNLNDIIGLGSMNNEIKDKRLTASALAVNREAGELLLSVYFDFNSYTLDAEAVAELLKLAADEGANMSGEWLLVGYADELGTAQYNKRLSEQRANEVSRFLRSNGARPALTTEGRGQITLTADEYASEIEALVAANAINANMQRYTNDLTSGWQVVSLQDRIKINRKARRVDILVKSK